MPSAAAAAAAGSLEAASGMGEWPKGRSEKAGVSESWHTCTRITSPFATRRGKGSQQTACRQWSRAGPSAGPHATPPAPSSPPRAAAPPTRAHSGAVARWTASAASSCRSNHTPSACTHPSASAVTSTSARPCSGGGAAAKANRSAAKGADSGAARPARTRSS
eukprot:918186-Prymnesium_polylepis.1